MKSVDRFARFPKEGLWSLASFRPEHEIKTYPEEDSGDLKYRSFFVCRTQCKAFRPGTNTRGPVCVRYKQELTMVYFIGKDNSERCAACVLEFHE